VRPLEEADLLAVGQWLATPAHLFKHRMLGLDDAREVWASDPLSFRRSRRRIG